MFLMRLNIPVKSNSFTQLLRGCKLPGGLFDYEKFQNRIEKPIFPASNGSYTQGNGRDHHTTRSSPSRQTRRSTDRRDSLDRSRERDGDRDHMEGERERERESRQSLERDLLGGQISPYQRILMEKEREKEARKRRAPVRRSMSPNSPRGRPIRGERERERRSSSQHPVSRISPSPVRSSPTRNSRVSRGERERESGWQNERLTGRELERERDQVERERDSLLVAESAVNQLRLSTMESVALLKADQSALTDQMSKLQQQMEETSASQVSVQDIEALIDTHLTQSLEPFLESAVSGARGVVRESLRDVFIAVDQINTRLTTLEALSATPPSPQVAPVPQQAPSSCPPMDTEGEVQRIREQFEDLKATLERDLRHTLTDTLTASVTASVSAAMHESLERQATLTDQRMAAASLETLQALQALAARTDAVENVQASIAAKVSLNTERGLGEDGVIVSEITALETRLSRVAAELHSVRSVYSPESVARSVMAALKGVEGERAEGGMGMGQASPSVSPGSRHSRSPSKSFRERERVEGVVVSEGADKE
ncbi:hypothetical protein KIPB_006743 [Kipferlia bialata]|uniref:Uncharacterized protein n=1 Tax=Kipferlia bialata TaxID=797122 RepID=A0A9K3CZN3_9EUKA|nr:hypothetical protein KIPB_006743 [Kipferlia bialata]|eukprot:g6743.t1